jgi:hypothetical protein
MKILESVIFFPKEGKNNALYHSKSLDKYDEETKEAISKELDEIKKTELDNLENKLSFFDTLTNRKFS